MCSDTVHNTMSDYYINLATEYLEMSYGIVENEPDIMQWLDIVGTLVHERNKAMEELDECRHDYLADYDY